MPRREFSIIVVPHAGGRPYERRFSVLSFRVLLSLVSTVLLGVIVVAVLAARVHVDRNEYQALKTRNALLEQELSKLDHLKIELDRIRQEDDRIREMLGFEQQPPPLDLEQLYRAAGSESAALALTQAGLEADSLLPKGSNELVPSIPPVDSYTTSRSLSPEHPGIDLVAETGTLVRATADGRVVFAGWDTIYGNSIRLQHQRGFVTFYGHLLRISRLRGDTVRQGQTIGYVGSTGRSTAPHLHYEVTRGKRQLDPELYFR